MCRAAQAVCACGRRETATDAGHNRRNEGGSPMPARVLVLSAAVGAGHLRAAQAVELALREVAPDAHVQNVDILTLTNAAFRKLYGSAYLDLVNHAPHVLGYVYDLMDRPR